MSIISDALKKAQQGKVAPLQIQKMQKTQRPPIKNSPASPVKIAIIVLLIFISVCAAFLLSGKARRKTAKIPLAVQPAMLETPAPEIYPTPMPTEAAPGEAQLNLTGIIFDGVAPVAIINNQIVAAGETIGEARLLSIEPNRVKLEYGGTETILYLR